MKPLPLPSRPDPARPGGPTSTPASTPSSARKPAPPPGDPDARPSSTLTFEGRFAYQVLLACGETGLSCVVTLLHEHDLPPERLKEMAAEAAETLNTTRVPKRRRSMADSRMPVCEPGQPLEEGIAYHNERFFPDDVEFFQAVMMDRFGFSRLVLAADASVRIEPTITPVIAPAPAEPPAPPGPPAPDATAAGPETAASPEL